MNPTRALLPLIALLLLTFTASCSSQLAQTTISDSDAAALDAFPHGLWNNIVSANVDDKGRANYTAIKADSSELNQFTGTLAVVGPKTYPKLFPDFDHRLAYFINGYNALAMLNVLQRYPGLTSLEDIIQNFFYFTEMKINGRAIDLYNLENEVIRPMAAKHYNDAGQGSKFGRIHFALNCASDSCPQLPPEAFTPDQLEAQLQRETNKFVREERNVSVDHTKRTVTLSRIFDWYADDFTNDAGKPINQLEWINLFLDEDEQLETSYEIKFRAYNWTLNDQALYDK